MLGLEDLELLDTVADGVFDHAVDPSLVREFLADPRHHLVVADDDGVVVGMASALHYVHPDKPAELWINEVGVADSARRQGVGRHLMQALLDHGRSLGCRTAWVLTEPENVAARALYAGRGGRAESTLLFSWSLEEEPAQ